MFLTNKVMVTTYLVTRFTKPQHTTAAPNILTKTLNNSPDLDHHNKHTPPFHENAAKPRRNTFPDILTHYHTLITAITDYYVYARWVV
jgi:hypothetical protein